MIINFYGSPWEAAKNIIFLVARQLRGGLAGPLKKLFAASPWAVGGNPRTKCILSVANKSFFLRENQFPGATKDPMLAFPRSENIKNT